MDHYYCGEVCGLSVEDAFGCISDGVLADVAVRVEDVNREHK